MIKKIETKQRNKAGAIYLTIVLGVCYLLGILEALTDSGKFYQILGIGFTFIPVIAAVITRRIADERAKYHLSLRVWKNMKYWLLSALVPGILIAIGAAVYYLVFPEQYSGIFKIGLQLGTDAEIAVNSPVLIALACVAVSAVMIPIQLLELGEEIGWRGYLLGFQVERYGERKAVLINGVEWGLAYRCGSLLFEIRNQGEARMITGAIGSSIHLQRSAIYRFFKAKNHEITIKTELHYSGKRHDRTTFRNIIILKS